MKLANDGTPQWQKALGGTGHDSALGIQQTTDQGYVVVGSSDSNNGDVSGNHGNSDVWVVKLDATGTLQWQRSLGGSNADAAYGVLQTPDDGFIIAGDTRSTDGDVTSNHGFDDVWLVKLDAGGSLVWQHTYGGSSDEFASSIVAAGDGGYVISGASASNDGDVTGNHGGGDDFWLFKIDANGLLQWQKTCGGSGYDVARGLAPTNDGGFVASGISDSNDGNVSGNHGSLDCCVVKVDAGGVFQWLKSFGGSVDDFGQSIIETANGDLVAAGSTYSNDGDVSMNHGSSDVWVVRLNNVGTLLWAKCMGGSNGDVANTITLATDGGYAFAGDTNSNDGDVTGAHGAVDIWVVKLAVDHTGVDEASSLSAFALWPNPASNEMVQPPAKSSGLTVTLTSQFKQSI